jgi:ParB family transcriptional regulator, chromosome partitioning protein
MTQNKRNALGRGLSALLENSSTDITSKSGSHENAAVVGAVSQIPIDQIEANPFQPRTHFEEEALSELAESIKLHGIIQPVTVRKMGYDKYQLISGERRFRASSLAGLSSVPAYVRIANDQAMLEMAIVENIQRENLNAIEVAISYKRLIDECSLTQEALSEKVSKQRSTITNYLRLLKLPDAIQIAIRDNEISMGHARALINIDKEEKQLAIFQQILDYELSVRQVEELVREEKILKDTGAKVATPQNNKQKSKVSFEHEKITTDLSTLFGTKVDFKLGSKGKGKIVIEFNSNNDLQRIIDILDV